MATEIPIACTLPPNDYRRRLAEVAALSRDALRRVERREFTLDLRYAPEAAARVRRLVQLERSCCAFLQFELHEGAEEVQLLVTVPPAAAGAVPELLTELTGGRQSDA
jgi:hypothetical protein